MDDKKYKEQIKVLEEAAKEVNATKETALKFLIKGGFVTRSGKLTKRYGGK